MSTTLAFACSTLLALSAARSLSADVDLCRSDEFRRVFLEGQKSADYPSVSDDLVRFADRAVPCLQSIVNDGGESFGLPACEGDRENCKVWAVNALGWIGTQEAQRTLLGYLESSVKPRLLRAAMGSLARLSCRDARPALRNLLNHGDAEVRGAAVLSLGAIGDVDDLDAMVKTTLGLSTDGLMSAVRGLELLGDPRVIPPLERAAAKTDDLNKKHEIERAVARLRAGKPLTVR